MARRRAINAPARRRLRDHLPRRASLELTDNRVAVPIAFAISAFVGWLIGHF